MMYRIDTLKPAGDGWWEGRIEGPQAASIPLKHKRPGATEEEIWTALQNKRDELNIAQGMITACTGGWRT